jgi:hypothetical protein
MNHKVDRGPTAVQTLMGSIGSKVHKNSDLRDNRLSPGVSC